MNILFIIGLIVVTLTMIYATVLVLYNTDKKPRNNVHFYVARDKFSNMLSLYLRKPIRRSTTAWASSYFVVPEILFDRYGLNPEDFKDLKWEDEPVEVFLNLEG